MYQETASSHQHTIFQSQNAHSQSLNLSNEEISYLCQNPKSFTMEFELQKPLNMETTIHNAVVPYHQIQENSQDFNNHDQNQYYHHPNCSTSSLLSLVELSSNAYPFSCLTGLDSDKNRIFFDEMDNGRDLSGGIYQDCYGNECVSEFTAREMDFTKCGKRERKDVTDKDKRVQMNEKFQALRNLIPNPTKNDIASIVGDAIEYINKLKEEASELKFLVDKKRCARERLKRSKTEDSNSVTDNSSWIHKKSKNTEVDVRIVDNEVTVKLTVRKKKINCLLLVSRVLQELHLDIQHVGGGHIGDCCSYLFSTKICEGSIVYLSGVANKLIEVLD